MAVLLVDVGCGDLHSTKDPAMDLYIIQMSKLILQSARENEFTKNMNGKIIRQGRVCGLPEYRLRVAGRYAGGQSSEIEDAIAEEAFLIGKKGRSVKILIYGAGVVGTFPLKKGGGNEVL